MEENKKEDKPKYADKKEAHIEKPKDKKLVIDYNKATTKDIIEITKKPKEHFSNKKQLCALLEKEGYKFNYGGK